MNTPSTTLKNGDQIPALGLGTWKAEPGEVREAVLSAINAGYRHFDCAAIYGNEKEIGQAFTEAFSSGKISRQDIWVTSKLWNDSHKPHEILPAITKTLSDLCLDYLDLYLIHWPVALRNGTEFPESDNDFLPLEEIPLAKTWKGMEELLEKNLTRHIGVSNYNAARIEQLMTTANHPPEFNQIEAHPFLTQKSLIEACQKHGIIVTAYAPLGSGKEKSTDTPDIFTTEVLKEIAVTHSTTPAAISLAWAVNRGTVPIPKSINTARQKENLQAASIQLTESEIKQIDTLNLDHRFYTGAVWITPGSPYTYDSIWNNPCP
ncbi:MAG: aldo/keto reductase [Luteolibacter sp.]